MRGLARRTLLSWFRRLADSTEGRAILAASLEGCFPSRGRASAARWAACEVPYAELGRVEESRHLAPIFITARFRSGSTLLWNLFRHLPGVTAYYEPLNERRWFDPSVRGSRVDSSHRRVEDYWREYEGMEDLAGHYRESWIRKNLLMDEQSWDPALKRYVSELVRRATGRAVLQFNRIDFRLAWFRRQFPGATLVHLYRNPRDQWCSTFLVHPPFPPEGSLAAFAERDEFYLLSWAADLELHFPFLSRDCVTHPYELFYLIWRLSHFWGRTCADHSIAFEDLVDGSGETLRGLFEAVGLAEEAAGAKLETLIERPRIGRWRDYADDGWFRTREARCETLLREFFEGGTS